MTKKVTKKDLKKLVEGLFMEDGFDPSTLSGLSVDDVKDVGIKVGGSTSLKQGLDLIARTEDPINTITMEDFDELINDPSKVTTNVEQALNFFKYFGSLSDDKLNKLKEKVKNKPGPRAKTTFAYLTSDKDYNEIRKLGTKAAETIKKFYEYQSEQTSGVQTVSNPRLSSRKMEAGDLPQDYMKVMGNLFDSEDFTQRIDQISKISSKYFNISQEGERESDSGSMVGQSIQESLSEIMILDLFNYVTKELDSGSGAYFFEAILGLIAGGRMSGKDLTKAGKAGAYDFIHADGTFGSAKFFAQNSDEIRQATSGFRDLYEESGNKPVSIKYVIALKKQDLEQIGKEQRGTSDPSKLIALELYTPTVTYDGTSFKIDDKPAAISDDGKDVRFYPWISANESSSILFVASMRTETFRKGIETKISAQKTNLKTAFEAFKNYFDLLNSAEEQARVYASTGDVTDGTKTQEALTSANEEVEKLKGAFQSQEEENQAGLASRHNVGYPTSEGKKITPNFLKKIIEESFKK
jgi:hypothetical protein